MRILLSCSLPVADIQQALALVRTFKRSQLNRTVSVSPSHAEPVYLAWEDQYDVALNVTLAHTGSTASNSTVLMVGIKVGVMAVTTLNSPFPINHDEHHVPQP